MPRGAGEKRYQRWLLMVFIDLHRDSPNGFWWSPKFGLVYNHDPLFGPVIINPPRVSPHKISPSAEIYFLTPEEVDEVQGQAHPAFQRPIWLHLKVFKAGVPKGEHLVSFYIYSHREDENSSSLTISKGQFWAPWKPRKNKYSSHQHHFQLHHRFSCPKSRSSNNLPYRFFFHLCPFGFLWWEEYIPNGHQIKRNMMINYKWNLCGSLQFSDNSMSKSTRHIQKWVEHWVITPKKLLVFMGLSMFIRCFHVASHENKHHFYIVNQLIPPSSIFRHFSVTIRPPGWSTFWPTPPPSFPATVVGNGHRLCSCFRSAGAW